MPTSEGDIYIDGEPANPQKHNISFVFQEPTCFPWRTVRENVAYGMEIKRWDKKLIEGKLDAILPLVGLADTAELYPNQVSASMVQRIAVARAFAVEPDLLMMDEPYGQLDIKLRFYLEDELSSCGRPSDRRSFSSPTTSKRRSTWRSASSSSPTSPPTSRRRSSWICPRPRDTVSDDFIRIRKQVTELIRWW